MQFHFPWTSYCNGAHTHTSAECSLVHACFKCLHTHSCNLFGRRTLAIASLQKSGQKRRQFALLSIIVNLIRLSWECTLRSWLAYFCTLLSFAIYLCAASSWKTTCSPCKCALNGNLLFLCKLLLFIFANCSSLTFHSIPIMRTFVGFCSCIINAKLASILCFLFFLFFECLQLLRTVEFLSASSSLIIMQTHWRLDAIYSFMCARFTHLSLLSE